ncbi:MAG: saccharopine dehydrogenase NADP-binding domain-containing protein [Jatrophihabitans sp.]
MPARTRRPSARSYDIVVFGATGFAGKLTAEYLARTAPPKLRWALAGRNQAKLETVRAGLATIDADLSTLPLLSADVTDLESLRAIAESTQVVATTVGPYVHYGDALVAACAAAGTDYLDLTGEPEFVNTSYVRHQREAERTGARIIHAAGFDSIPHDLGVYFTVQQLPENVPLTVSGYVRASGTVSGGTFHSALTAFSRPRQNAAAARDRKALESFPAGRAVHTPLGHPHRDPTQDGWAVPMPTIDPQIIGRSAHALERYGPDFTYSHFASLPHLYQAVGGVVGVGTLLGLAQVPPARRALMNRLEAGDGPSANKRAKSWFTVTFVGEGGGERVVTRVSGGDPGYDETAKMLAESAMCLVVDDLPRTSGQVTSAQAMGDALIVRLRKAGMDFQILS